VHFRIEVGRSVRPLQVTLAAKEDGPCPASPSGPWTSSQDAAQDRQPTADRVLPLEPRPADPCPDPRAARAERKPGADPVHPGPGPGVVRSGVGSGLLCFGWLDLYTADPGARAAAFSAAAGPCRILCRNRRRCRSFLPSPGGQGGHTDRRRQELRPALGARIDRRRSERGMTRLELEHARTRGHRSLSTSFAPQRSGRERRARSQVSQCSLHCVVRWFPCFLLGRVAIASCEAFPTRRRRCSMRSFWGSCKHPLNDKIESPKCPSPFLQ
jgi:hypothetical protein